MIGYNSNVDHTTAWLRAHRRVELAKEAVRKAESDLIQAERDLRNVNKGSAYAAAVASVWPGTVQG